MEKQTNLSMKTEFHKLLVYTQEISSYRNNKIMQWYVSQYQQVIETFWLLDLWVEPWSGPGVDSGVVWGLIGFDVFFWCWLSIFIYALGL